jgi:pyruvate dehydrogenase E2 component (dihydrolipoamide acetyltransferase)
MPIELKMPALSPTMEEGTLAKWLVKEGDKVASGDILAEIETDKATMEFEAVDEGTLAKILVPEGSEGVKVGAPIAILAGEGEDASAAASAAPKPDTAPPAPPKAPPAPKADETPKAPPPPKAPVETPPAPSAPAAPRGEGERIKASPLARRLAQAQNIDLSSLQGSGPGGRIVRADIDAAAGKAPEAAAPQPAAAAPSAALATHLVTPGPMEQAIPHDEVKLSNIRKTIARRLTEAKQQVPHIYLTVDIQLDALLKLRSELNAGLDSRGVKLSVNDLLIKALAQSLVEVPECNVAFAGDHMLKYNRADISVAVSIPAGLITPIIVGADSKSVSAISTEMKELAGLARDGKLQPQQYQGGTGSLSNMACSGSSSSKRSSTRPRA